MFPVLLVGLVFFEHQLQLFQLSVGELGSSVGSGVKASPSPRVLASAAV
ncbi:hypothetical protein KAJ02_00685 [Candidatus Bipolaricaulota bacterium]|nr:hypothetical protein [Candidatus Bipolaricaulota bacterium]